MRKFIMVKAKIFDDSMTEGFAISVDTLPFS